MKKKALGRGLGDLLGGIENIEKPVSSSIGEINIDKIKANSEQPRKDFDEEALEELANSIREVGVIQPITVRQLEDKSYQIISGERRYKASKIAGLKTIPAYVKEATEGEVMQMALIENIQREDLNPLEIALAYQNLIYGFNLTQNEVSEKVGKKRATVANYMRLLKLPAPIQLGLKNNDIQMGHARALLTVSDPKAQVTLFKETVEKGYSVRRVEEIAKALENGEIEDKKEKVSKRLPEEYNVLKEHLSTFFNTKVQLTCSEKGKGKISIPFTNEEELERIIGMLDSINK